MAWVYPATEEITGNTKVKEADNKLQNAMNDFETWVTGTGGYVGAGLPTDILAILSSLTEDTVDVEW